MSTLNVANLVAANITTSSGLQLTNYTNSTRPSSDDEGTLIWNTDELQVQVFSEGQWQSIGGGGREDGSSPERAITDITAFVNDNSKGDGDYWVKPSGQSAIQVYINRSNAPSGYVLVMVARGRESTNWWSNSGTNYATGGLTNANRNANTPISVAPGAWVNALVGGNWNGTRILTNRLNSNDSWWFEGGSNGTFDWGYFPQNPSSVNASATKYYGLWRGGGLHLNYGQGNRWTDTLNYGNGNNCDRTFTWSWSGHGSYQGWSGGSSCTPSGGFQVGGENHYIQLVNVFVAVQ